MGEEAFVCEVEGEESIEYDWQLKDWGFGLRQALRGTGKFWYDFERGFRVEPLFKKWLLKGVLSKVQVRGGFWLGLCRFSMFPDEHTNSVSSGATSFESL